MKARARILDIDQTRYYAPDEMETLLKRLAREHSSLAKLYSIGQSIRGRELWMMELTNQGTGPAEKKPGELIFAMIHAAEVMGAAASLYTICDVLDRYGHDDGVTELLDQKVLYIMPYMNPDGGDIGLNTPYRWVGNARYMPGEEQPLDGLYQCDVNGDGMILEMRVEDPDGEWKVSEQDPRLLVPREPGDCQEPFYRRLPEGLIRNYDGAELVLPKPRDGNLNRNFPENWGPEFLQEGAGEYPLSEPEVAAFVRFVLDHPNIGGSLALHTNAGAFLFPELDVQQKRDVLAYRRLAQKGRDLTGYAIIESVLEQFTVDKAKPRLGVSDEWLYRQLGKVCFTVELWDWLGAAGVERDSFMATLSAPGPEEQLKLLAWNDEVMEGKGFMPWKPFAHPQLGEVEIGGWTYMWPTRNAPPGRLLVEEVDKLAQFMLVKAGANPQLRIDALDVDPLDSGMYRVSAVIANGGFLPTYVTEVARLRGLAGTIKAELKVDAGAEILDGAERDVGHLAGWSERDTPWVAWNYLEWEPTKRRVSWIVRAQAGTVVELGVSSMQAGQAAAQLTVGA